MDLLPILAAFTSVPGGVVEAAGADAADVVAGRRGAVVHVVVAHAGLAEVSCNETR